MCVCVCVCSSMLKQEVNNLENYLCYIELIAMGITWICSYLLLLILFLSSFATSRSIVKTLPGFDGDLPFKLETGLVNLIIHFSNFYLCTPTFIY